MLISLTSNLWLQTPVGSCCFLTCIVYFPNPFQVSHSPKEYSISSFISQTSNTSSAILSLSYDLRKWSQSEEIPPLPTAINLPASLPMYSSFSPVKVDKLLMPPSEANPSTSTLDLFCSCLPKNFVASSLLHHWIVPLGSFQHQHTNMW